MLASNIVVTFYNQSFYFSRMSKTRTEEASFVISVKFDGIIEHFEIEVFKIKFLSKQNTQCSNLLIQLCIL